MDERTDEYLMEQYRLGDIAAFEALYLRHKGSLFRYFTRQLADQVLAQDLYQELWGRIIKSAQDYQPTAKWTTWAYRIAHNLVIDHKRALKPVASLSELELNDQSVMPAFDGSNDGTEHLMSQTVRAPDNEHDTYRLSERLKLCIDRLPHAQREVFLLSEETGMTVKAIAEVVSVSAEAAKSRLRYAKSQLQTCLSDFWAEYTLGNSKEVRRD
jgi:RNA polymerase sigma-70 factor (ECF subfamily)